MKKLLSIVLLAIALVFVAVQPPALAGDAKAGKAVFTGNCQACHLGGKNTIKPAKSLKKEDLEKYGMFSAEAIISQVTNGKNSMPAFGGRLTSEEIDNVANYVLNQSEQGW